MMQMKSLARCAALIAGVLVASSCDTRLPTQPTSVNDVERPQVRFSLPGGATNSADVASPLVVTVTATDNVGVTSVLTTARNGALVTAFDSVRVIPAALSTVRAVPVPLGGAVKGDKIVVRSTVIDVAMNVRVDSIIITVGDSIPPAVSVVSSKSGRTLKGGDTVDVKVTAIDSSGIAYAGYRLLRINGTDTTVIKSDSVFTSIGSRTTSFTTPTFSFVLPASLLTGPYTIAGFAADRSALPSRLSSFAVITIADGQRPTISLQAPTPSGRIVPGDSILVRARITDNIALARVTFRGVSLRGVASLGTADTVVRYPLISAPGAALAFANGTRDTIVQRYLKVQAPVDTLLDSLVVYGIVTDASGNADTARVTVGLVPRLSLITNKPGAALKNGDAVAVSIVAGDTTSVSYAGYRVYRVRATDSVLVQSDSVAAPPGTTTFRPAPLTYVVPDTLTAGSFTFVAFERGSVGLVTRLASGQGFILNDATKPAITLLAPLRGTTLNVGDSVLVTARITDNIQLQQVTFSGNSTRGNASLGTQTIVPRLGLVTVPPTGGFRSGLRDTTISRYLTVISPIDTTTDTLVVSGVVRDAVGLVDSSRVSLKFVNGPAISIITPQPGDSASPGISLQVRLSATHGSGIVRLGFRIRGDASWPTPLNDSASTTFSPPAKPGVFEAAFIIPANAPPRSFVTITPYAVSGDGVLSTGSPLAVPIRSAGSRGPVPRVVQTVSLRSEISDSVTISASGSGIVSVGYELTDTSKTVIKRDSVTFPAPYSSAQRATLVFNLSTAQQGKRLAVISFAYDQAGQIGYSVPTLSSPPQSVRDSAFVDSTLIVFGRTFALPAARRDVVADLVVDPDTTRANVFLSNKNNGRLEVWSPITRTFAANGIVVGSQPWGMAFARTGARDTLYVANSGGTNLSRVFIGSTDPSVMKEDLAKRIVTRASYLYKVTEVRDETGKIRISVSGPFIFSDRPQYVEQSSSGRLYVSTRPTSANTAGTIRFLDPKAQFPDYRFILDFASQSNDGGSYLVANVDSVGVVASSASTSSPDFLVICDHDPGTNSPSVCASSDSGIVKTIAKLKTVLPTTDIDARQNADEKSLALTDTTYATSSGDGKWIAFGEGNKTPFGRAFLVRDDGSVPKRFTYAAPNITIADLTTNAADRVFGLALDSLGSRLAVHGNATFFAKVDQPFTARLQGTRTTFNQGAGVAFFPGVDSVLTVSQDKRLAFVASANGTIEAIDIAYYDYNRGSLATKSNLYGPLRVGHPTKLDNVGLLPSDPNYVRVKLYGLSTAGLVVIDVRNRDVLPGP